MCQIASFLKGRVLVSVLRSVLNIIESLLYLYNFQ